MVCGEDGSQVDSLISHSRDNLLGMDWINNGCLFSLFVNDEVHIVVWESWKEFNSHVLQLLCGTTGVVSHGGEGDKWNWGKQERM